MTIALSKQMKRIALAAVILITAGAAWYFVSPALTGGPSNAQPPMPAETGPSTRSSSDDPLWSSDDVRPSQTEPPTRQKSVFGPEVGETRPSITTNPENPTRMLRGPFTGTDDDHRGSGFATIYQVSKERRVLRFEQFSVTSGPNLRVVLIPRDTTRDAADRSGYRELDHLKKNAGDQNYEIPASVDLDQYRGVAIYSASLRALFAFAAFR